MAEGWAALDAELFELDAVLPDQYNQRSAEFTPEQCLMEAVLLDAIRRYRKGSKEARRWVAAPEDFFLYSFKNICTTLGIAADTLRRRLEKGDV
jgi:hypothetical protein